MLRKPFSLAGLLTLVLLLNIRLNRPSVGLAQSSSTPTASFGQIITISGRFYTAIADNFETHQSFTLYSLVQPDRTSYGLIFDSNVPPNIAPGAWVTITGRVQPDGLHVISFQISPEPTPIVTPTAMHPKPLGVLPDWQRPLIRLIWMVFRLILSG